MRNKRLISGITIILSILILLAILGMIGYYYLDWNWYPAYGHMGYMMPFGFIFMILFWIGAAAVFIHFFEIRDSSKKNQAKEILNQRLSKGEISIEEYEKISKVIKE
ncbi:MAG: SHOCT domain-containing protein [Candidatus Izemoplasmataceae bacterium]